MMKITLADVGKEFKLKFVPNIKDLKTMVHELPILYKSSPILVFNYFANILNGNNIVETFMFGKVLKKAIDSAMHGHYANSKGQIISKDKPDNYFGDEMGNFVSLEMENNLLEYTNIIKVEIFNPFDFKCSKYLSFKVDSVNDSNTQFIRIKNIGFVEGEILLKSEEDKDKILALYDNSISMEEEINNYKNSFDSETIFGEDATKTYWRNYRKTNINNV